MPTILVTWPVSHLAIFCWKKALPANNASMSVTSDVFQQIMSLVPAAPQSAAFVVREQQLCPEGTAVRQLSTAAFSAAELGNAGARPPTQIMRFQALGGPSYKPLDVAYLRVHELLSELSKPHLVYVLSHCCARVNIPDTSTSLSFLKVQPVMLRSKDRASSNMFTMRVTDLTFQFLMSPLKARAPRNIESIFSTCPTFQPARSWLKLLA
mmetsp:Transcript_36475/g.90927  ORF Transcript_36475/g.90927 Transcript_36475/m.90927 type:complete len:210 (-) Transcript_36475:987-1616(-)